jgi:DNA-binding transcriptional LysR family regulator
MLRGTLDDLAAFAEVARQRSFTRAAAELRLSTSALSQTIKVLETRLGVRLLQRTSRSVSLTSAGEELLSTLAPALGEIEGALADIGRKHDVAAGTVRITTVRHAFESVIRPVLPELSTTNPGLIVEVLIDYGLRDIVAERLDGGIRLGEMIEKDMIAARVGPDLRMAVVASPAYLASRPVPQTPQDLAGHRCINYRLVSSGAIYAWEFEKNGRALNVKVDGLLTFNEPELMLEAALDGLGVAYIFEEQVIAHVAAGRLVRLLSDWTPAFPGFFFYYPSRRQQPPALTAFLNALRRHWTARTVARRANA